MVLDEFTDTIDALVNWNVGVERCYVCCDEKCVGW